MAVISVLKDLDQVKKSLKWLGQSTDCFLDLCGVVLLP